MENEQNSEGWIMPGLVSALAATLRHPKEIVRESAAKNLLDLGAADAAPAIVQALADSSDHYFKYLLTEALCRITPQVQTRTTNPLSKTWAIFRVKSFTSSEIHVSHRVENHVYIFAISLDRDYNTTLEPGKMAQALSHKGNTHKSADYYAEDAYLYAKSIMIMGGIFDVIHFNDKSLCLRHRLEGHIYLYDIIGTGPQGNWYPLDTKPQIFQNTLGNSSANVFADAATSYARSVYDASKTEISHQTKKNYGLLQRLYKQVFKQKS